MLSCCGVSPACALQANYAPDGAGPIASVGVRRRGELTYLYIAGDLPGEARPFRLELDRARQVYEMTADEGLGVRQQITGMIRYGEARVYALSLLRELLRATLQRPKCLRGDRALVRFALATREGDPGDRLVRLTYEVPTGGVPRCCGHVAPAWGSGELRIMLR